MDKRRSCRAIVIDNDKLVTMYRNKEGKIYYTFPGGGMEGDETKEACVVRECQEEFGINVKPIKHVYTYENDTTIQYFYTCKWLSGEFGSGAGEEFQEDRNCGDYRPTLMPIEDIPNLPLMPPEIAKLLVDDITQHGVELDIPHKLVINQ